jgi:hypothetical protein
MVVNKPNDGQFLSQKQFEKFEEFMYSNIHFVKSMTAISCFTSWTHIFLSVS